MGILVEIVFIWVLNPHVNLGYSFHPHSFNWMERSWSDSWFYKKNHVLWYSMHNLQKVITNQCWPLFHWDWGSRKHDDVIKWEHLPRNWPFVRGINWWPVDSPHKGQWCGALMFPLICAWTNSWANNHCAHYGVTVMVVPISANQLWHWWAIGSHGSDNNVNITITKKRIDQRYNLWNVSYILIYHYT